MTAKYITFFQAVFISAFLAQALPSDSLPLGGWLKTEEKPLSPGLRVLTVIPGQALALSGIRPGDLIFGCDSISFSLLTDDTRAWFRQYITSLQHGTTAAVYVVRGDSVLTCAFVRSHPVPLISNSVFSAAQPDGLSLKTFQPVLDSYGVSRYIPAVTAELIASTVLRQDAWHTSLLDYVMQHPASAIDCGKTYVARKTSAVASCLSGPAFVPAADAPVSAAMFVQSVSNACKQLLAAFPSTNVMRLIAAQLPAVMTQVDTWFYLQDDTNTARFAASYAAIESTLAVDFKKIDSAAQSLLPWSNRELQTILATSFTSQYSGTVSSPGCKGSLLAVCPTPYGDIVIGGPGNNQYDNSPLVVIDTGGDDTYANRAASGPGKPVSLVFDWDGNDMYTASNGPAVAAGVCGIGMVFDYAGNDLYSVPRWGIGAGYFGQGLLVDYAGNDRYLGQRFVQGVGLFGKGSIIDQSGDDSYLALRFSQAVGFPGGEGCLCDLNGNDLYLATLGSGSEYGTPGIYSGMSQGIGVGFRLIASGGIGSLIDLGGDDRYESGTFSQGGGYYLGCGILYDRHGNDIYNAMRYCQGFAAHTAAGIFIDLHGDDAYTGTVTANQGLAWDHCVVAFRDENGNDSYTSKGLALGAACISSYAEFQDGGGSDTYTFYGNAAAGCSRSSDGSTNVALFRDRGGDADTYSFTGQSCARNDIIVTNNIKGIFIDQ